MQPARRKVVVDDVEELNNVLAAEAVDRHHAALPEPDRHPTAVVGDLGSTFCDACQARSFLSKALCLESESVFSLIARSRNGRQLP